jgi:cell wall-associated NlpC family hydrolase
VHRTLSGRLSGRGSVAALAVLGTIGGLVLGSPGLADAKPQPPARPTQVTAGQVHAATAAQNAVAAQIGQLSADIAAAKIRVQQSQANAELAEQRYALAVSDRQKAEVEATKAEQTLRAARTNVAKAHEKFIEYVRASYMSGGVEGTAGTLLTASDPSALLQQSALQQYQTQHKADAIGAYQTASVIRSNAEAAKQRALAARKRAEAREAEKRAEAQAAFVAAQQQQTALQNTMAQKQTELEQKESELVRLTSGRKAWLKYQADYADYKVALANWQREQERKREERLRRLQQRQQRHSGGGGGSYHSGPSAPSGGSWTAAKGRQAANRALSQVGTPYAWAGGGAYGPSRGVCDPFNGAPNDCNVIGYDCSGLAMYAWGASWWAHYAATQYTQAGRFHPGAGNLMAGDLIFWSSNGTVGGIHHVAVYIGNGRIVEAPYSGGYVQVASLYEYGGFFGATRPFT